MMLKEQGQDDSKDRNQFQLDLVGNLWELLLQKDEIGVSGWLSQKRM